MERLQSIIIYNLNFSDLDNLIYQNYDEALKKLTAVKKKRDF